MNIFTSLIWLQIPHCKEEYQQSSEKSIKIPLPFPTRYLCETGYFYILHQNNILQQFEYRSIYKNPAFFY